MATYPHSADAVIRAGWGEAEVRIRRILETDCIDAESSAVTGKHEFRSYDNLFVTDVAATPAAVALRH